MEKTKENARNKSFKEIEIKNPFLRDFHYWDKENELFDKVKVRQSN